ncbi:MAG: ABC transporter ATP-binding protein [Candidatus Riflebacteria bacterium]|nr:ABC transporter ATP-binding protein [Candidatus Riflebacteria bacterium]
MNRDTDASPSLTFCGVNKGFSDRSGKKFTLTISQFSILPATVTALIGVNGAGKTTFLKIAAGITKPDSGDVICKENLTTAFAPEIFTLPESLTVKEAMKAVCSMRNIPYDKAWAEQISETLQTDMDKRLETQSKGLKQRASLASALVSKADLFLLDEPTSSLDPEAASRVKQAIKLVKESGCASIFTTHRLSELKGLADQVLFLDSGKIIFSGTPEEFLSHSKNGDPEESFKNILNTNKNHETVN